MDATSTIWQSATVRAAIESGDRGAIMRSVRRGRHLILAQLGTRCGYSISTLSRMERGLQPLTDIKGLAQPRRRAGDSLACPLVGRHSTTLCADTTTHR